MQRLYYTKVKHGNTKIKHHGGITHLQSDSPMVKPHLSRNWEMWILG